jgi:hypothetical protein
VGPDQGNMWHGGAIRLTPSRLVAVAVAVAGRAPASGGDETTTARPRSRGFRRGSRRCGAMRGLGGLSVV